MLGWDVGYVWPLLESAVATTHETWDDSMGNPHEATTTTARDGATVPASSPPPRMDPPPYESVTVNPPVEQQRTSLQQSAANGHRNSAVRESRTRAGGSRNRGSHTSSSGSQRFRPPRWPHQASSTFACLSCVIGLCNVSRFSVLVYIYKGFFIFQFLFLSFLIGIPMLYMQMALGQYLGAGMLDMWYISPVFKGLGFAMLYLYILLGVYQALPLSWLFIYFKDSFITLKDSYKWGKCHHNFARSGCIRALNSSSADFYGWSVPSYFHGRVLGRKPGEYQLGELKFEVAFNLCLVWLIVFICLSRGPKTFGKVVYVFGMLPIALLMMVTMRMGQQWSDGILELFTAPWKPVYLDASAWLLAAREVFITWGLLGTVALHICSHNRVSTNITKNVIAVSLTALVVLITSSCLFACATNVFHKRNLSLALSSYEEESSVRVLKPGLGSHVNVTVTSFLMGVSSIPKDTLVYQSGYQVLRLITETFPAALAVEGVRNISSFWSICFYTAMILFGLGQQVVLWYCVVESVIAVNYKVFKAWHTTLTFITCNLAFLLGLPITSNMGIYIVYYLDFCIGSLWWIVLLYFIMLFAILFIRGKPYSTDQLVNIISHDPVRRSKILPFLTFAWNVVLPMALLLLTISFLRMSSVDPSSAMGELMDHYPYWRQWAKTLHMCIQIFPLLLILVLALYQASRVFLSRAELTIMEKLKVLCCPVLPLPSSHSRHSLNSTSSSLSQGSTNSAFLDDPPPKYTPPPSYSTATSRMLAKQLDSQLTDSCTLRLDEDSEYPASSPRESVLAVASPP